MGGYLSEPIIETVPQDERSNKLSYGASSMQGWRIFQEDAHNCILDYGDGLSYFAVYDGHGGAEVAKYCSTELPKFLQSSKKLQSGKFSEGLEEGFLNFDATLTTPEIMKLLKTLSTDGKSVEDDSDAEIQKLHADANMPVKELLAKYKEGLGNFQLANASPLLKAKKISSFEEKEFKTSNNEKPQKNGSLNESESELCPNGVSELKNSKVIENSSSTLENGDKLDVTSSNKAGAPEPECSSSTQKTKTSDSALKKGLRKKENVPLIDSDDDDSDESDEEFELSKESENGSGPEELDDDSDEEDEQDDDDQWEDMEGEYEEPDDEEVPGMDSGCTAVVAIINGSDLYVANAGDSRCVVCRNSIAVEMSCDHKPEDEVETKRINAAGGHVTLDGRVNGGLNLSRAIGDHRYKQNKALPAKEQMISAQPDIQTLSIDPDNDEFMVLACDGIWNTMSSQQVVDFVKERINSTKPLSAICEELFAHCLAPDTSGDGTGCDNMTAMIVTFKPRNNTDSAVRKPAVNNSAKRQKTK